MGLREEMRSSCTKQLDKMVANIVEMAGELTAETGIDALELLKLASGGRTDTLEKKLLRVLYARAEEAMVKIWNDQLDLLKTDPEEKL